MHQTGSRGSLSPIQRGGLVQGLEEESSPLQLLPASPGFHTLRAWHHCRAGTGTGVLSEHLQGSPPVRAVSPPC